MTDAHEPPGLSHIGLRTADLDRAARFYTRALPGAVLRRRDEPDRRVWVRVLGVTLEIAEVAGWKPLDEAQRRALPQIGLLVGPRELDQIVNRLDAAGVPHHGPTLKMAGQAVGVYFSDCDGNPFSLSCPEGYPSAGLPRNARMWFPSPWTWAEPVGD
ncbi:MAG TPA: VOC family protein [Chloroflexota bacterium]|nr:VOC family protein [Chloroflexota bacterium]